MSGEYDRYEKKKMLENAKAWLKQAQFEKDALKVALKMKFINENGSVEEWNGVDIEAILSKIDADFEKLREEYIEKLEKELEQETTT
jgi:superfamily I DNA and/or RNA helicase